MLFDSLEFFTFFGIVLLLYWQLPRRHQNFMLLGASYLFYGWWNWRYLALLLGSSLADFAASHLIARSRSHHAKRAWLIAALVVNFGVLFVFKYFDFFVDSSARLLSSVGLTVSPRTLRLALPVESAFSPSRRWVTRSTSTGIKSSRLVRYGPICCSSRTSLISSPVPSSARVIFWDNWSGPAASARSAYTAVSF